MSLSKSYAEFIRLLRVKTRIASHVHDSMSDSSAPYWSNRLDEVESATERAKDLFVSHFLHAVKKLVQVEVRREYPRYQKSVEYYLASPSPSPSASRYSPQNTGDDPLDEVEKPYCVRVEERVRYEVESLVAAFRETHRSELPTQVESQSSPPNEVESLQGQLADERMQSDNYKSSVDYWHAKYVESDDKLVSALVSVEDWQKQYERLKASHQDLFEKVKECNAKLNQQSPIIEDCPNCGNTGVYERNMSERDFAYIVECYCTCPYGIVKKASVIQSNSCPVI